MQYLHACRRLMDQLTDTVTSLSLSTMGIPPPTGVSVNISCEFVRPGGREGDELIGIGEVVKLGRSPFHHLTRKLIVLGKTMAYTRVSFYTASDKLVAYGSHTKHLGDSRPTTSFSEDGEEEIPSEKAKL